MRLPLISQSQLKVSPIDWGGLNRRYMNPGELEVLTALMRSARPARVLEIGVNEGRTAKAMLTNVPSIKHYIGVDVLHGYTPSKKVQRNEVPIDPGILATGDKRFNLVLRRRGSLDLTPEQIPECDVVFIDGDHGREAVMHDTQLARRVTRPGGLIIWHDYHDLGTVDVRDVLDEMAAGGAPIVHVEGTWLAYEQTRAEEANAA